MNLEALGKTAEIKCTYASDQEALRLYVAGSDASAVGEIVGKCREELGRPGESCAKLNVIAAGSMGYYNMEPIVVVEKPGQPTLLYEKMSKDAVIRWVRDIIDGKPMPADHVLCSLGEEKRGDIPGAADLPLFSAQRRVVLRNCGRLDPEDIYAYVRLANGYAALADVLQMNPDQVIDRIKALGLRGRGGAGFPTGEKWRMCRDTPAEEKLVICNAVDGDPKARTAQLLIDGDPHSVLEGLLISAYAVGASRCIICIDNTHTVSVQRLQKALEQMRSCGLVGENILDSGFGTEVEIRRVLPSLVAGEQTALLRTLQGRQPMPYVRETHAAQNGLEDRPTLINNIETLCWVTALFQPDEAGRVDVGSVASIGTKVITISGDAANPCTVEVPLGTTLGAIVETIGGVPGGNGVKAVQLGGPSGTYFGGHQLDLSVDYETLEANGAILGSGTVEVFGRDTCAVEMAVATTAFLQSQSCGKCVFCREGTLQLSDILDGIAANTADARDLELVREIGGQMKTGCICGLGRTAADPVLSCLALFPDEFESHIKNKRCLIGGNR